MTILKFTKARHADAMVTGGTLMLSSLAYFECMETVWGKRGIGDRTEGVSILNMGGRIGRDDLSRHGLERLASNPENMRFIGNTVYRTEPHSLIFSATHADLAYAIPIFSAHGYDAAVEITDPEGLSHAIAAGQIVHVPHRSPGFLKGCAAEKLLRLGPHDQVAYGRKTGAVGSERPVDGGPLAKDRDFEAQKEYRFCFEATSEEVPDRLEIRINNPRAYMRRIDRSWEVGPEDTWRPKMEENLQRAVEQLIAEIEAFEHHDLPERRAFNEIFVAKPNTEVTAEERQLRDEKWRALNEAEASRSLRSRAAFSGRILALLWQGRLEGKRLPGNLPYRPGVDVGALRELERILSQP